MTTVRRFTQALKCSRNAAVPSGRFLKKIFAVWQQAAPHSRGLVQQTVQIVASTI
jgi:hypothetical protein